MTAVKAVPSVALVPAVPSQICLQVVHQCVTAAAAVIHPSTHVVHAAAHIKVAHAQAVARHAVPQV